MTQIRVNDSTMRLELDTLDTLKECELESRVMHIFNQISDVNVVQLRHTDTNKQIEVFRPGYKELVWQIREFEWRHNVRLQKEGDQNHHNTEETVS